MQQMMHRAQINSEKSTKGSVQIAYDVAQETNRKDGDDAHDEIQTIGLGLDQQDAKEAEETEALQECPSVKRTLLFICQFIIKI